MTVAVDEDTVREFVTIISEHADELAKSNGKSGVLQLTRLSPIDGKLVPSRFKLDDIDGMVRAAVADANAKHNVYIEGLMRSDLRGTARGPLADTEFVFGLVIDADHDKGKEGAITVRPSLTIETSPGNFHYWYLLTQPLAAGPAKTLGNAIRVAVGADHDTGIVSQPYRVPGTPNFPSKAKRARGRATVEPTRITEHSGRLWDPDELRAAFTGSATTARAPSGGRRRRPTRRACPPSSCRTFAKAASAWTRREGGQVALRTLPPRGGRTRRSVNGRSSRPMRFWRSTRTASRRSTRNASATKSSAHMARSRTAELRPPGRAPQQEEARAAARHLLRPRQAVRRHRQEQPPAPASCRRFDCKAGN